MQTRISVYKLYTKSKALYIQVHQAAVSLLIGVKHLHYNSCVLSGAQQVSHFSGFPQASNMVWQHPDTVDRKRQLSLRQQTWQDFFFFFYIDTKSQTHLRTHYKKNKHYTHLQTLYTTAHTYVHNHSMALWHQIS